MLDNFFFLRKSCCYEIKWKEYGGAREATRDGLMRRMRFVCWITKNTGARSEYVIPTDFPRHRWLRERA
jgi:hypothetical protein